MVVVVTGIDFCSNDSLWHEIKIYVAVTDTKTWTLKKKMKLSCSAGARLSGSWDLRHTVMNRLRQRHGALGIFASFSASTIGIDCVSTLKGLKSLRDLR
jgi:hypothetical protein